MRPLLLFFIFSSCSVLAVAQRAQRVMLAAHADLIRSDHDGFFEKVQTGLEGSFYVSRKFAVTGGVEWWSGDNMIGVAGIRFCPIDEAFVRIRGLVRKDFSLGAGFSRPLSENLRVEAMADYFFRGPIAIRAGLTYGIGGRP